MPLARVNSNNAIRGHIAPNAAQRRDCQAAINMLVYADLGRGAGTLHASGAARLDMQGRTQAGDANLQVQIGNATAAAALISHTALREGDPTNQRGVSNAAIGVLNQSLDSGTIWNLNGSIP